MSFQQNSKISKTVLGYYRPLRKYWGQTAQNALRMARAYDHAKDIGVEFNWEMESESPREVYGEPSYYECESCDAVFFRKGDCPRCTDPKVRFHDTGVYFDPTAEFQVCIAEYHGEALDSLGMIEGARGYTDYRGYWFMVECEMALEVVERVDAMILDATEVEETLA